MRKWGMCARVNAQIPISIAFTCTLFLIAGTAYISAAPSSQSQTDSSTTLSSQLSYELSTDEGSRIRKNTPGLRWGRDGHLVTGLVAQQLLTDEIQSKIQTLIPEEHGSLANVANWADEVKEMSGYYWSAPLHYINTQDWACKFVHSQDCADNMCVSGAITNYTSRLASETGTQQSEALKFLVHFCGDIHQPLHVGFKSDEGGNTIRVDYQNQDQSLHELWDSGLIYTLIQTNFNNSYVKLADYLVSQIKSNWIQQASNWTTCAEGKFPCPDEWANETASLACTNAYMAADGITHIRGGDHLGTDYYERNQIVVQTQLAKSGVRMAAVLTLVLGDD